MTRPTTLPERAAVLISTYLEPHLVERIVAELSVEVLYDPALLPTPRYGNDHGGVRPELDEDGERRWLDLMARADVAFDFDWRAPSRMAANAPRLIWVQATSAGIGAFVKRHGLDTGEILLTTAAGTHAAPLAEFAVGGVLHFVKDIPRLQAHQREHHWERHVSGQLAGRRVTVVGLGAIGRKVVETFDALGTDVTGVGRVGGSYAVPSGVRVVSTAELDAVLPSSDVLVLAVPLTQETDGLIDAGRVAALPPGAIVVNIARGQVIDEAALTQGLATGRIGGAVLDVFEVEPLPTESALWDLPNVLVSPHSASTASVENEVLVDLFIDNFRRLRNGEPLVNRYRPDLGY
ncbi:D-2-hydroxyacid dehydrogenase [Nostocoides sp. Soil756]|uniref:D-2-hydroxyacid dehydrogenase n=1 Tax=Nostocoides sp. Soil756 TaxID=1736399 RepID=UPI0006F37E18|nr:D-2-hydroxyacid dehydrogenase [Tetrasphaera sp. Soil756]KRE60801.1 oxidoreductase [Tetrasphaera sp. Soil756]